jgi:predicted short-subunit dehydrogenase-like oxidoreductase (DUF2520 family)
MRITLIGAGNLATRLGLALKAAGHEFVQVFSRTEASAQVLATLLNAEAVVRPEELLPDSPLYICALKDDALLSVLPKVTFGKGLLVHTAGSLPMNVLTPFADRIGVFYPLQTFSKEREVNFKDIPVFIEAFTEESLEIITQLAESLNTEVRISTYEQRVKLHISAVFACNFVNYLYTISNDLMAEQQLDFKDLLPLIRETTAKLQDLSPLAAQTGPAMRYDRNILEKHLNLLENHPDWQALYEKLTLGIFNRQSSTENPLHS